MIWLLLGNRLLNLAGGAMPERWSDASFLVLSSIVIHLVLRRFTGLIVDEYAQLAQSEALLQAKFLALPSPAFIYDLATMRILDANPAALEFSAGSATSSCSRRCRRSGPMPMASGWKRSLRRSVAREMPPAC